MQNTIIASKSMRGGGLDSAGGLFHASGLSRSAFTLAEVLITLGIIGIVAAMTLPNIIAGYEKKNTIARLQKSYTMLNQAFKHSELDNGESVNWNVSSDSTSYFKTYWKPYLKILHICENEKQCGYTSNTPWYRANGKQDIIHAILKGWRESVILSDGTFMSGFSYAGFDSSVDPDDNTYTQGQSSLILIDINGGGKPNKFGRDVFYFVRVNGKGILPYGYNDDDEVIDKDCSEKNFGYKCAAKIIRNSWTIPEDYPWK